MESMSRISVVRAVLLLPVLFPWIAAIFPVRGQDAKQANIRVEVEMVSLPVTVMTRNGRHVADLQKEDFQVFEDNVQQRIAAFDTAEEPISVVL